MVPRIARTKRVHGAWWSMAIAVSISTLVSVGCGGGAVRTPSRADRRAALMSDADRCHPTARNGAPLAGPDVHAGRLRTAWGTEHVCFEVVGDIALTEGDIVLAEGADRIAALGSTNAAGIYEEELGAVNGWRGGVVPYTFDDDFENRERVLDAIEHWQSKTKMRFIERGDEDDYVTFRPSGGCSSSVGRKGGQQFVSLGNGCGVGATIHEIGHAVGLWHEQARVDRDDHVVVLWDNIREGLEFNFLTYEEKGSRGADHGPYDLRSIMHYGSYDFSRNGEPTMLTVDGDELPKQRDGLTTHDVEAVAAMYRAP